MAVVSIHQAITQLSRLIARVEAGERIVLARGKIPVALITPIERKPGRKFGAFKGKIKFDDRFFEPLPDDILKFWTGGTAKK